MAHEGGPSAHSHTSCFPVDSPALAQPPAQPSTAPPPLTKSYQPFKTLPCSPPLNEASVVQPQGPQEAAGFLSWTLCSRPSLTRFLDLENLPAPPHAAYVGCPHKPTQLTLCRIYLYEQLPPLNLELCNVWDTIPAGT